MKMIEVDFSFLSAEKKEELIKKVKAYAWDTYDVAGNSNMFHVVWQHNEIFEDLFPELADHLRYM